MPLRKLFAVAALTIASTWAQGPLFQSETVLVQIEVRATDRNGDPVLGLEASDFELRENGGLRQIVSLDYIPHPQSEDVAVARRRANQPEPAESTPAPTRIYVDARIGQAQRERVYRAIQDFLGQAPLGPVVISLRGTPFSNDRAELLATLDTMNRGGGDGVPPLLDPAAAIDEEIANIVKNTGIFTPVLVQDAPSMEHTRRVALEAAILQGWIRLTRDLGVYPGKKVVVLFGRGMRYDAENALLFDRLSEQAILSRVQFYVADTRGLLAPIEGGEVMDTGPYDPTLADRAVNRQDLFFSQTGVRMLAEHTGGRAVIDSNDFGLVFERVLENLGGFYLLGYRPGDSESKDHLRRLNVRTPRGDVKLDYLKAYRSEPDFADLTNDEKSRQLQLAAALETPFNDLPVTVSQEHFLGRGGLPILAYSAGIAAKDTPSTDDKKGRLIDLSVVAMAASSDGETAPHLVENRVRVVLNEEELARLGGDESAYFQFSNTFELEPGDYRWRVVLRDESTGSMGSYESRLNVPDLASASSLSSLLLTTRAQPVEPGKKNDAKDRAHGITVGEVEFLAEAARVFRAGQPLYMVYAAYQLSEQQLEDPVGPRVLLERDGILLEQPPFEEWRGLVDRERKQLEAVARLNTASLEPGHYRLRVMLLEGQPALTQTFQLVAPPAR